MANRWGNIGHSDRLYFGGSKITADGDCSHKIKTLTPWKESHDQPRQHIKEQRHYFADKSQSSQSYGFPRPLLSYFSHPRLCATPRWQSTRFPCPWDSPGKNTGVSCHFLLQHMKVKSEREVAQSSPTLHDPMSCSLPGSSVHGIFQARVLEWGAITFSGFSK